MPGFAHPGGSLSVLVLGRFAVERDGEVVRDASWRRRKAAALLKILALQPGRLIQRHRLIDMLWPDADEEAGANALHKALHFIRRDIDPGLVALDGPNVRLHPSARVDAEEFERLASFAINGANGAAPLEQALAAYPGDLLPEDVYEPWTEGTRLRLRDQMRALRLKLAAAHAAERRLELAIETLAPLARDDRADEDVARELMVLHARCGDRRSALRVYDLLRDALYDDLGIAPAAELQELREQIAAGTFEGLAVATAPSRLDIRHVYSTDGTRIAYTSIGAGDATPLVMIPFTPWGHLEHDWEYPEYRRWLEALGLGRKMYRYDGRGLGLSQHGIADYSAAAGAADLEAVIRTNRLPGVDLFVGPDQGPVAFTYAARGRGIVRRMVLYMTWLDGAVMAAGLGNLGLRHMMRADWDMYCLAGGRMALGVDVEHEWIARHVAWMQVTPRDVYEDYYQEAATANVTDLARELRHMPILAICMCQSSGIAASVTHMHAYSGHMPNVRLCEMTGNFVPWGVRSGNIPAVVRSFLDAPDEEVAPGGGWQAPVTAVPA